MFQDVDLEKWAFLTESQTEAGAFAAAADGAGDDRDDGEVDVGYLNKSTGATEEHHLRPSLSNANLQVYIGAHDYLVMVPVAARSQPTDLNVNDTAEASTLASIPRGRISSFHSADFVYGRVEVRAKLASRGSSGFWLMPSDAPVLGRTPCARVSIAEVGGAVWLDCDQRHCACQTGLS